MLLSASAVGYYGDTGRRGHARTPPPGADFLAQLCARWEAATAAAAEAAGVRVVLLRTGLVLGRGRDAHQGPRAWCSGSASAAGMGIGRQYWPWISLDDEIGAIRHLLTADVSGPVNLTGPTR